MTKIIVELDTFKYEDMQILLGSDILSRELHFYVENNNEIIPVSDVVKNRILTKIADQSFLAIRLLVFLLVKNQY